MILLAYAFAILALLSLGCFLAHLPAVDALLVRLIPDPDFTAPLDVQAWRDEQEGLR